MYITNNITEKLKNLPIIMYTASDSHNQEDRDYITGLSTFQILAVVSGEGFAYHNGKKYKLNKGSAIITFPNVSFGYKNISNLVTAYITVGGVGIEKLCSHYLNNKFTYFENININRLQTELNNIYDETQKNNRQGRISALTYSLFINFLERNLNMNVTPIDKAVHYIETNFAKKITLEEIAKECTISVSKLCHDFKEKFNKTVFEFIVDTRLNFARNFLYFNPHARIKDACISSGFDDNSYFCKAYKNKFGVNPSIDKNSQTQI